MKIQIKRGISLTTSEIKKMKKARFQAHVKNMEFSDITKELAKIPEFSNIKDWKIKRLGIGEMFHTYIFSKGKKKYFIKETKEHEAQVNYFLAVLKLGHIPYSVYPELLKKNILVLNFIEGGMMPQTNRKIDLDLLKDFTIFQNKMTNKKFFDRYNILKLDNFSTKNDSWFTGRLQRNLAAGKENLIKLKRKYGWKIIDNYIKIADFLKLDEDNISKEFADMPFARQHHDLREDNIIGKKHKLIDWGSSYGYGPFVYDVCLFLINNKKAFDTFVKNSDIAKKYSRKQLERWLYVALADRFDDFCKWHLKPGTPNLISKNKLNRILNYNYKTYKYLLKNH
jgi:hypothetical protein